jgi:hypothetical protein
MTPCRFVFDDSPAFDGFAHGSTWNGFDNVAVTPDTLAQIKAYYRGIGDECVDESFADIAVGKDGLISLGWGFTTQIVD